MSKSIDVDVEATLREFNIELELIIATMLMDVPITAVKTFYKGATMDEIVAKTLRPIVRHARRR